MEAFMFTSRNRSLFLLAMCLFSLLALTACSGRTVIDFNIDPTTGVGNVVVNPAATAVIPETGAQPAADDMSQVALFAVIVAILLGTIAIVFAVARRPREREE
jgi:hypothetical protein